MRHVVILTLLVLGVVGCAATVRWDKTGVSDAERQRDQTECASRASLESSAPVAQSSGTMYSAPVDSNRVQVRPYDTQVYDECMRARGYERASPGASS
jgi:hypothetical protein